jgi:hypothetical protein
MKKVVFIVFVSLLFPASSYGATKVEGSKCFTHSKTKKVSGVQYVCHKKNGKLVWTKDNSVKPKGTLGSCQCPLCCPIPTKETTAVETPTPTPAPVVPTPTPTPSPAPVVPTPTPTPDESSNKKPMTLEEATELRIALDPRSMQPCPSYLDRIENSQGELLCMYKDNVLVWHQNFNLSFRKPSPTPTTIATIPAPVTTKVQEPTTLEKIYSKITNHYNHKNNFSITVIKSPDVDSSKVEYIINKYEKAINSYSFDSGKKIRWVFMNENEKPWYVKKSLEIDDYDWTSWWDSGKCFISSTSLCSYGNSNTKNPIFYTMVGSKSQWTQEHDMIAEHEAVHMYQVLTFKNGYPNCWIVEGQANLIGFAMASRYSNMLTYRNGQMLQLTKFVPGYRDLSKTQWVDTLKRIEKDEDFCFKNQAGYSLGMMAVESLFLNHDAEKVDKFIIDYSVSGNFDQSLNKFLSINSSKFYEDFADHIINAINGR